MLRGIKRKLQEGKESREQARQENREKQEQARQEAECLRRLSEQRKLEEAREKKEIQNKVLAILREGKVPDLGVNIAVPFKMQKNEKWILAVDNVAYAEMRVKREVVGRSAGVSVRVMKGVSVRTGASKGTPVETDVLTPRGSGTFAVSTKHVFFSGERSFRIPLNKIVSVQSVGDGLEIVRDRASAQPEYFGIGGADAEFIANLIHLLPDVNFGRGEPEMQPVNSFSMLPGNMGADDMLFEDENS